MIKFFSLCENIQNEIYLYCFGNIGPDFLQYFISRKFIVYDKKKDSYKYPKFIKKIYKDNFHELYLPIYILYSNNTFQDKNNKFYFKYLYQKNENKIPKKTSEFIKGKINYKLLHEDLDEQINNTINLIDKNKKLGIITKVPNFKYMNPDKCFTPYK